MLETALHLRLILVLAPLHHGCDAAVPVARIAHVAKSLYAYGLFASGQRGAAYHLHICPRRCDYGECCAHAGCG